MYADDKHLTYADKDVNIIQSCLNKHLLNISRLTEFMLIGSRLKLKTLTASPVLSINGTLVNQVSTSQSLGVLIDANLTWGSHIVKLAKKKLHLVFSAAIKRVRQFVPPATLHLIYKALILPHFDYCNREFTQRRQRWPRNRHLKSEFALPQTLSRLFHLV